MKFWKRFGGYMPILATIVVMGCVGTALKGYAAPVYEVEQPENIQSTEADAKEKKQFRSISNHDIYVQIV